jgi:PAS domain S-box-containing protein
MVLTLLSMGLIISPASTGFAFPARYSGEEVSFNFAPGSIVRFERFGSEDGLSQNAGLDIFQDSLGYLWIGSQDGLNRYDGYSFKVFKHDPDDEHSLSYNSILKIAEDHNGALWIGTWGGGLNHYDPVTEQFTRYQHDPNDPNSIIDNTVTSIKKDSKGNLWVGTLNGLDRFDPKTSTFEHFVHDDQDRNSLSSNIISVIFEDSKHQLWIGTGANGTEGSGLNRFDPSSGEVTRYQHSESDPDSLSSNNIAAMYEAPNGTLWIATGGFSLPGNGLDQFDPQTGKANHFKHDANDPHSIGGDDLMALWGDSGGMLWVGTWTNGLSRMSFSEPGVFTTYKNDPYFPDSLSGNEVWSLFKDRTGILWVGTAHSGINKLTAKSAQFSLYRNNPSDPTTLALNATGAFSEDKRGNIWVATWGAGLDRFNPSTGQFKHYRHEPENPNSLSDDLFMTVYVDEFDNVWAGTLGKGLNKLDPATNKVTHFLHDPENPNSIAEDNIAAILSDQHGGLWIGTFGGLSHYDPNTDTFTNYSNKEENSTSLSHNMVVSLLIDSNNHLWAGTWGGGLNQLDLNDPAHTDPQRASFTRYRNNPDDLSSLSEDSVWAIHESNYGTLWLGTQLGLNQFDPVAKKFKHYTEKQGLPNNVVLGILSDNHGNLWLTTNHGIAQFNPKTTQFTLYDASDGLQSNEFNSNAYFRAHDGKMYVGGVNGFNVFNPDEIRPNPVAPQVIVTRFEVFNEPMPVDFSGGEPIRLNYKQNFISFEFAAFDFQAPQKNQYAYKLEGFNQDWINAGSRRYATFTNLNGGEYIFRVKAANSDGTWNDTGVAIPVVITPPVWKTWWFNGVLIVVLGTVAAAGFRFRLNTIREQNIHLETLVSDRTSQLRETNQLLAKEVEQRKRAEAELEKRAAQELQESEERFRAMFEHSAVGIGLFSLDRTVIDANPAFCRIFGSTREQIVGSNASDVTYPEDNPEAVRLSTELINGERDSYAIERRYVRNNGEVFWAHVTMSSVRDLNGKPLYIVGMVMDIDKQKHAAEELHKSQAQFQAIFDNVAVGVAVMTLGRRILAINTAAERIIGYALDELQGVDPRILAAPEDRGLDVELFQELIEGKRESYVMERRYRHKSGRQFWARVNYSLVRSFEGRPDYLIGIIEDIDEQKRAAERLAQQEADYLLTLQHRVHERTHELEEANDQLQKEIQQRVRIEKELAERAAEEAVTADRTRLARDLHDAVTQTLFSASLTAEVLPDLWEMDIDEAKKSTEELRQLTRGALAEMRTLLLELRPATLTQTRLSDLIRQLCEAFIGRSRLPIKLSIDGDCTLPPEVQIAIYRIAQESLNNVFKYARATQVDVNLSISEERAHFKTCDNGIGFDMFTAKPTSLGLRIMRERAEAIGATLEISSQPGSGTCVEVIWYRNPNLKLRVL